MWAGLVVAALFAVNPLAAQGAVRDIGSRLELFINHYLIDADLPNSRTIRVADFELIGI